LSIPYNVMRTVIVGFCAFWLKRTTVCFRLLRLTTLTMIQRLFLLSIHYPSRLSGSDFQSFPHCPVGTIHSITGNACHSRVTPNGRSGISAIQDMTSCHSSSNRSYRFPVSGFRLDNPIAGNEIYNEESEINPIFSSSDLGSVYRIIRQVRFLALKLLSRPLIYPSSSSNRFFTVPSLK
jgi:hypothetical protein